MLVFILTSVLAANPDPCTTIKSTLDQSRKRLQSLEQDLQELTRKFESAIHQDLDAQAGNLVTSVYRDNAKKALFAKTKLQRAIQKEKEVIEKSRDNFCKSCEPTSKSDDSEITIYCERCKHPVYCKTFAPPDI